MSDKNTALHIAILEYLQRLSRNSQTLDPDELDIATQCLSNALGLDLYDSSVKAQFLSTKGQTLEDVFAAGTNPVAASPTTNKSAAATPEKVPTKEDIAKSEQLKTIGNTHLSSQDFVGALENYNAAIELNPSNHILWANKATCLFKMEKWDETVKSAQQSIALKQDYSKSHYRLGLAYTQLKRYGDAVDTLTMAKQIAQSNGETALVGEIDTAIKTAKAKKNPAPAQSPANNNPMGGLDFGSLASMLGGGGANGGGMGGLEAIMQNPMFAQMAQGMMQNMMGGGAGGANPFAAMMGGAAGGDDEYDDEEGEGDYGEEDGEEEQDDGDDGESQNANPQDLLGGVDMNDPTIQRIMQEVQANPMAAMQYLNNPEVMAKLGPLMQQMMGGMMGGAGRP